MMRYYNITVNCLKQAWEMDNKGVFYSYVDEMILKTLNLQK